MTIDKPPSPPLSAPGPTNNNIQFYVPQYLDSCKCKDKLSVLQPGLPTNRNDPRQSFSGHTGRIYMLNNKQLHHT